MKVGEWTLVNETTGEPMVIGGKVKTFRGETFVLKGGRPPLHEASTGRVWVVMEGQDHEVEYYPSVIGARWVEQSVLQDLADIGRAK